MPRKTALLGFLCAMLVGVSALAQTPYPPPSPPGPYSARAPYPAPVVTIAPGAYFRITGGAVFLDDINVTGTGSLAGAPATGSGKASFKTGYIFSGILGYQINPYLGLELEGGYTKFDVENGTGTITTFGGSTTSAPISGSGNAIFGLANFIVAPLGIDCTFAPYIGGGGGVAGFHGSGAIGNIAFGTTERTALAMADAIFGVNISLSPNVAIGTRYRFLFIDSQSSQIGTVTGHSLSLTASINF